MAGPAPTKIDEARDFIRRQFTTVVGSENLETAAGLGRILAGDFRAGADLPRFDASAMDGYAVRTADLLDGNNTRRIWSWGWARRCAC